MLGSRGNGAREESPVRSWLGRAPDDVWLGAAAGIAGITLMVAVEMSTGPAASVPLLRYKPQPMDHMAIAASPDLAFMVTPTLDQLETAFREADYSLDLVRKFNKPVPRLHLATLPSGLADAKNAKRRKKAFLALVLPMILEASSQVALERRRLLYVAAMSQSGVGLPADVQSWLDRLAHRYKTEPDRLDVLLRRVDVIPVSLAMAQAAIESGWGTSRFAIQGNAIFGQWTKSDGRGLVPAERRDGRTHKVRSFDRLFDSVTAYFLNLNTHPAYHEFRVIRQEARQEGQQADGYTLAAALELYSEQGDDYIDLLRNVIRVNRLDSFDDAILGDKVIAFESGA